jgi:hypothetical protein
VTGSDEVRAAVLDLHSRLLLALPGQLMVLAAAVLTYLTGFVPAALALGIVSILSVAGLLAVLRPVPGSAVLVGFALVANALALVLVTWQALVHLPATAGTFASLLVSLLAAGAFGPTAFALASALRTPRG